MILQSRHSYPQDGLSILSLLKVPGEHLWTYLMMLCTSTFKHTLLYGLSKTSFFTKAQNYNEIILKYKIDSAVSFDLTLKLLDVCVFRGLHCCLFSTDLCFSTNSQLTVDPPVQEFYKTVSEPLPNCCQHHCSGMLHHSTGVKNTHWWSSNSLKNLVRTVL